METQSLNHWTTREVHHSIFIIRRKGKTAYIFYGKLIKKIKIWRILLVAYLKVTLPSFLLFFSFFPHFFLSLCTRKNFKHVQKWKKWLISPHAFIIQLRQLAIHSQNGFYQYFSPPPYYFEASCHFICKYFNLNIKYSVHKYVKVLKQ